jgi:mRNA-degrading endonuclease YafQ of YafQ-DinJ toxin-antitoxin module
MTDDSAIMETEQLMEKLKYMLQAIIEKKNLETKIDHPLMTPFKDLLIRLTFYKLII